jgi:hypothetical protein
MADQIYVRAAEGIAFPHAAPRAGFAGYERVLDGSEQDDDHVVPGGIRYRRREEPEPVPNTVHYRRAIRRGDIEQVEAPTESAEIPPESAPSANADVADTGARKG